MTMRTVRIRLLAAVLTSVLLVPWPDSRFAVHPPSQQITNRLAAAQGLALSNTQLKVQVTAAAAEFAVHQDLLSLAARATGIDVGAKPTGN